MAHAHAEPGEVINLNTFGETKSTALVKTNEFEVIRVVVEASKPIAPHHVDGPITVQCLSGNCTFFVGNEPRKMSPGSWLYLPGGTVHALESDQNAVVLVTILFATPD